MTIAKLKKKEAAQGAASAKKEPSSNSFEGKVVSMTGNKLVMRNKDGTAVSHVLAKDAKVTCNGKPGATDDLKAGTEIRVSTKTDNRNVATGIECLTDTKGTANCCK
jgi:RNase P/RNase MRP subunit p29